MGSGGGGPAGHDDSDDEGGSSGSVDVSTSKKSRDYFVSKEDPVSVTKELIAFGAQLVGGHKRRTVSFASSKKERSLLAEAGILFASSLWRRS